MEILFFFIDTSFLYENKIDLILLNKNLLCPLIRLKKLLEENNIASVRIIIPEPVLMERANQKSRIFFEEFKKTKGEQPKLQEILHFAPQKNL